MSDEVSPHGFARDHKPEIENRASEARFERTFLIALGFSPSAVDRLAANASGSGRHLVQAAIAEGWLDAARLYARLSRWLSFSAETKPPGSIGLPGAPAEALRLLRSPAPVALGAGQMAALNAQTLPVEKLVALSAGLGSKSQRLALLTRQDLIDAITQCHGGALLARSTGSLRRHRPDWSAKHGIALWQALSAAIAAGLLIGALLVEPRRALAIAAFPLSVVFLMAVALRFASVLHLLFPPRPPSRPEADPVDGADLPNYTIFVPLFREIGILPHLASALRSLDYPAAKLDVKLVLEAADGETVAAVRHLPWPGNVDFILVPDCEPRTKPKALNYALPFANGELAVIYDAEDRPEPDQLRKAAARFKTAPPQLGCLQARLDFFNATENWLSRQFAIEYACLFRGIVPLLARFGLPVPLGGTSNHFRTRVLRELHAWDPFNVTEDADLGMRLSRAGYRVETLDSTTWEEACCRFPGWIKQRTRWLKGWMQTFAVHMRKPSVTLREVGFWGFLAFHAYFAGIVVSSLVHPLVYVLIAYDAATGALFEAKTPADGLLLGIALANFAGGYLVNAALGLSSLRQSEARGLSKHVFFIPVYWLLISAAGYRAVWQLLRQPFQWEKTVHGVSSQLHRGKWPARPSQTGPKAP